MPINGINDTTKHADFTAQQLEDVQRKVNLDVKENEYFSNFANRKKWPKGYVSISTRRKVHTRVEKVEEMKEDVAPASIPLVYASFSVTTKDYGTKIAYTAKEIDYNHDDILVDIADELGQWGAETKNIIVGQAMVSTKNVLTPAASVHETIRKAALIARKLGWKPVSGSEFAVIMTPELEDRLTEELSSKANQPYELPDTLKGAAIKGYVGSYKNFAVSVAICDKVMTVTEGEGDAAKTYQYLIFVGRMPDGRLPLNEYALEGGIKILNNPLGSGIVADAAGNLSSDDNHQRGSMAANLKGVTGEVVDDRFLMVCKFPVDEVVDVAGLEKVSPETSSNLRVVEKSPK